MVALDPKDEVVLLHDHYRDTFGYIRDREQRRDRLFVLLLVMFVLLAFQTIYPATVGETAGKFSLAGLEIRIQDLPLPALLDVTWVLTLLTGLKYCQTTLAVERQYPYLHRLEEGIGKQLQDPMLFSREGKSYLVDYPLVLNWAWFCYVIVFPLTILAGTVLLTVVLWKDLDYSPWHKLFATVMALALLLSFAFYQVVPQIARAVGRRRKPQQAKSAK